MKTNIFLIRHGQTERNLERRITGQEDSDLTPLGIKQAELTGQYLKKYNITSIYSSDLNRAYNTALIIGERINKKPIKDERLRENNLGLWKDFTIEEIQKKRAELALAGFKREEITPPGGENTYDHIKRVMNFLNELLNIKKGGNIAIVGHSGTNKILISYINNAPIDQYYNIDQSNCCINKIEYDNNEKKFKIITINFINHLNSL
jgi:probable phosphoglycerate mutase